MSAFASTIREAIPGGRSPGAGPFVLLCLGLLLLPGLAGRAEAFQIGRLGVSPQLDLEGMYDDNVWLREPGDPQAPVVGDWLGRVRPGLSLLYDHGPTDFLVSYLTEFVFYTGPKSAFDADRTRPDSYAQNHFMDLSLRREMDPRTSLDLVNATRIGTDVADLVEGDLRTVGGSGILPEPSDYRLTGTTLTLTRSLTRRVSLSAGAGYRYNWYGDVVTDNVVTQPVREEHHGDLSVTCFYQWHARNTVSVTLRGAYLDFGSRGESKVFTFLLGDVWQIAESFSLSLNVGAQVLDQLLEEEIRLPLRATYLNPTGDVGLVFLWNDFDFDLTARAGFQDSSGVAETVLSRLVRFQVSWNPFTDWVIEAFGQYGKDEAVSSDQGIEVESYQGGGSVSYQVLQWVRTGFLYRYIDQTDLGARGTSYKDNRFILSVILELPESLG